MLDQGPSRAALLEVRQEREEFAEGHRFLDEKRVLLAQEILRRLDAYQAERRELSKDLKRAREMFGNALIVHGLEGLEIAPAPRAACRMPPATLRRFLGIELLADRPEPQVTGDPRIPSLDALGEAFAALLDRQLDLAMMEVDLRRLLADYRRTERRVRALEDVLIPELRTQESSLEQRLSESEREESAGSRWFARRQNPGRSGS